MSQVESKTVIVGASAAGLAVAACLQKARTPFVLLEQSGQVATAWRGHYDRLHLHTSKTLSALPHLPFPRSVPRYPSRDEVVAYLEDYAQKLATPPLFGQRVQSIERQGDAWLTSSGDTTWRSPNVVIATGYTREPNRPTWPGLESFTGPVLHSSAYKNGDAWAGKRVLVVGIGNSGGEIALDLCERGAKPSISVRSPVHIVRRDLFGLSNLAWSIALGMLPLPVADAVANVVSLASFGPAKRLGLTTPPYGAFTQIRRYGRIPLIDVGTVARIRAGEIEVLGDVESFSAGGARFRGPPAASFDTGGERPFDAVVLATGYRPALGTLLAPFAAEVLDAQGVPRASGKAVLPGLYFCGFHVTPTGMLREIGREAHAVADAIACDT